MWGFGHGSGFSLLFWNIFDVAVAEARLRFGSFEGGVWRFECGESLLRRLSYRTYQ
ncbi:hypothetical protein Ddye_023628, partial [Dipteronia dyeriana]